MNKLNRDGTKIVKRRGRSGTVPLQKQKEVLVKYEEHFKHDIPPASNPIVSEICKELQGKMSGKAILSSVKKNYQYFFGCDNKIEELCLSDFDLNEEYLEYDSANNDEEEYKYSKGTYEDEPDNIDPFNNDDNTAAAAAALPQHERRKSSRSRKRPRPRDASDEEEGANSPSEHKYKPCLRNGTDRSDNDEHATEFLRLEREKLENSIQMADSLRSVASEISGLRDVMMQIRDVLLNNRVNL